MNQRKSQTQTVVEAPARPGDTRRPSLREEQKLLTRNRLLYAAVKVFRETGYKAARIDQITAEAGANRATFYLHFKDKLDVAVALGRQVTPVSTHHFMALDTLKNPGIADVRNWLQGYVDAAVEDLLLWQMLSEALSSEPAFASEYMEYMGRIADRMSGCLSGCNGKRRQIVRSKIVLVEMLVGRYIGLVHSQGLKFAGDYPLDALAEAVWNILFAPASPPARTPSTRSTRAG